MKKFLIPAVFLSAIGVSGWFTRAQVAAPPRYPVWQYAQFFDTTMNSCDFSTSGPRIHADTVAGLYIAMTGKQPIKHVANQAVDCTYLDIMNAAGAQGWEFVSETEDHLGTRILFKRFTQ